jgi:hypothetical protein
MSEKSILEQALLQVQNLEEAVKQNAKGILASTMKEELKDLLKESLEEEEEVAKDEEEETPIDEQPTPEEEEDDMSDDEATADDTENDTDLDNEPSKDIEGLDGGAEDGGDSLELPDFDANDVDADDDVMDMTTASDDEVLKVFKAMKPEDGIVVKKDGDNIDFNTGEDEYIIKLDGGDSLETEDTMELPVDGLDSEEDDTTDFPSVSDDMAGLDGDSEVEEEETIYEIELDEEEEEEEEVSEEDDSKEIEATEAARTQANDVRGEGPRQGMKYKAGRHEMNEEVENLKKQNAEYKKALVLFKDKLNEVAVFNANLAYATRLFTEHSTTKQEKLNILKRFDTISTMNEAKSLFTTIKTELGSKTTVTESVATKISNTPSTSSSNDVLSEAKAYENPQFTRIKEMMRKINK